MKIDPLLKIMSSPVFNAEGAGGSAAPAAAAPAPNAGASSQAAPGASTASAPDAGAAATPNSEGNAAPQNGGEPAPQTTEGQGEGVQNTDPTPSEFKLDLPEGFEQYGEQVGKFGDAFKAWRAENPDATAEDAIQWAAAHQAQSVQEQTQQALEARNEQISKWEADIKADKEFGGDAYDQNLGMAVKAIEAFGDDDLRAFLDQTGAGSHPAVVKAFMRAGKTLGEAPVVGQANGSAKKNFASALYGNS
jgi:hypothetical protein